MTAEINRRPATTIGELDLHLSYTQQALDEIRRAVASLAEGMATKQDIERIEEQMGTFATRSELDALEKRLASEGVSTTFDRWLSWITKVGAAAAVVTAAGGGVAAFVHYLDRMPK